MVVGEKGPDADRGTIVRRALQAFWNRGAEATSYNDIVAATGLSRKALYALWPEKDALVHEAMELYRAEVLGPLVNGLAVGGRAGLEAFWDALTTGVKTPGWAGCFLFRSAGGALRGDPVIARHFDEHVALLRTGITRAMREAQRESATDTKIDTAEAGWQVVAVAALISTYGAMSGNSRTVTALISAGRSACGLGRPNTRAPRAD
ncbi:hypothetical protein GCM10010869_22320 [Mesorhizobium tianshanense]|uniref:TetR family transcriptional regulator n=1 Tax=Mesorhizobium tianshanense TaxID=39844 RepID=A0A562P2K4_9HYPH|nr:TetR/AcrR family transcriptional regulator [Mesorhizobium tianshanense]TWI38707.1 TetR family transcriptional regulator [Mesorhizobium tianshanense]GLS36641.1 hypothetical protein GCM10010869_22320 [Mesorhizobium tianshanense]